MSGLFISVLNMSLTASYAALAVIIARQMLKKAPKIYSYILWGVVFFRLICPVSFESALSLIPGQTNPIPPDIIYRQNPVFTTGIRNVDIAANQFMQSSLLPVDPTDSVNPIGIVLEGGAYLWLIGIAVLLCWGVVSYFRLQLRVSNATLMRDNIYESDVIHTPFVLGFIRPRIYLPAGITLQETEYILQHEQTHLKRLDHLIKPLALLAVVVHWFNPLMWLSYVLMSRDMEMSCDESVMKNSELDIRTNYASSLLSLSMKQGGLLSPLAFGESNVKTRIKNILNYRRPGFWLTIIAAAAVLTVSFGVMANPATEEEANGVKGFLHYRTEYVGDAPKVGGIITLLSFPENIYYDGFELYTKSIPYALTVKLKTDPETRNFYTGALQEEPFIKNAVLLFSLIGNVEYVNFNLTDGTYDYLLQYTRDWADRLAGRDVREYSLSEKEFSRLMEILKNISISVVGGADKGTDRQITTPFSVKGVAAKVELLLEKIIATGPADSSNPYDYLDCQAFEELVLMGDPAREYMFDAFRKGHGDGLREYIMASACAKIMGIFNEEWGIGIDSGKEWFYKYSVSFEDTGFHVVDADYELFKDTASKPKLILPSHTNWQDMDDVIKNCILTMNRKAFLMGEKAITAYKIYRTEEESDVVNNYMLVNFHWFGFENGAFTPVSGSGGEPVRIRLKKTADGTYEMLEYRAAMDGGMWARSIREMFPEDLAAAVIPGDKKTTEELWEEEMLLAREYLQEIKRPGAPIIPKAVKDKTDRDAARAIYGVTAFRREFPDYNGRREILVNLGGKYPGMVVRCVLGTDCTPAGEGKHLVTLTKTWEVEINGVRPVSSWKYEVAGEQVKLIEEKDQDGLVASIK